MAARSSVPVDLQVDLPERLPERVEVAVYYVAVYYVVSESLANVGRHARASAVTVVVRRSLGGVLVEIVDDGVGGAALDAGSGLRGLADRVETLGGRFEVWAPGGGGSGVRAELPCD